MKAGVRGVTIGNSVGNWRVELIEAHRDLFAAPCDIAIAAQGAPQCGPGWQDLLGRLCGRIRAAIRRGDTFRFSEIKEKYGTLRVYWAGRFLVKVSAKSVAARANRKFRNISETAKQCCRSAAEVIRLILGGRLETSRSTEVRGYLGILVKPDQAARALRGANSGGMPLREAARRIGISDAALGALIKQGHVVTLIAPNPVNKCPQRLVPADEIVRFQGRYVSLWRLAKEHKVHIAAMKTMLDDAGVAPAFDGVYARLYRIADLAKKGISASRRPDRGLVGTAWPADKRLGKSSKPSRRRKGG